MLKNVFGTQRHGVKNRRVLAVSGKIGVKYSDTLIGVASYDVGLAHCGRELGLAVALVHDVRSEARWSLCALISFSPTLWRSRPSLKALGRR